VVRVEDGAAGKGNSERFEDMKEALGKELPHALTDASIRHYIITAQRAGGSTTGPIQMADAAST
jgi:hypothetical protein